MSLWADIDTYLATEVLAEMGSAGAYSTLKVRQVLVDDLMGPDEAAKLDAYPIVLVRSHKATQQPGAHGGGRVNVENIYEYVMIAVSISDGMRKAKQDAQELRRRMREFLRTRLSLGGLTSADGEHVQKLNWLDSHLEVWQQPDGNNVFLAIAGIGFNVQSI